MPTDFHYFAENSPNGVAVVDDQDSVTYANRSFVELFPASAGLDNTAGLSLAALPLPEPLAKALGKGLDQVRTGGDEHRFAWENVAEADPNRVHCRLIPLSEGRVAVEIEIQREMAKLRDLLRNERVLRRQSDMLRERGRKLFFNVIDELPIFVYMQRRDYSVAYANKKTIKFYGETGNRRCYEVFGGRKDPCPHCPTFRVFDTGTPVDWLFTDGDGRTFHIYDYPYEDENGEPLVMELGVDITELKRVEQELFQAQKMRAIGVLAGGIAHDLNNNLVPIIFNIDFALGKAADTPMEAPLSEALRAAYKAAELVEQVLEYSRQQDVSRSLLRLTPLARENLGLLQASLPEHVTLEVNCAAELDCVLANPSQIQQILLNLCRNAVQAMPDGGTLTVSITNLRLESQKDAPHQGLGLGDHVVMKVTDTGHGIQPEVLERIFEPFYTSKKKSGGTGMGLAVVHAITGSTGGSIHVDSIPGQGTTFTLYLPCCTPEVKSVSEESRPTPRSTGRLLLVDDDAGALQAMRRVLRDAGYEVFTADNGEEGLKEYFRSKGRYDLVITDQSMPHMTGMEMADRILDHDPSARVVICTGHVESNLETQARKAGVSGFLMKPMSPRMLVENIREFSQ